MNRIDLEAVEIGGEVIGASMVVIGVDSDEDQIIRGRELVPKDGAGVHLGHFRVVASKP